MLRLRRPSRGGAIAPGAREKIAKGLSELIGTGVAPTVDMIVRYRERDRDDKRHSKKYFLARLAL